MDRRIPLASVPNMRDLGGLPVSGGTVRRREVYRSTMLANLSKDDLPSFEDLGVAVVVDLRTESERTSQPDQLPPDIKLVDLDVLADNTLAAAANIGQLVKNPESIIGILDSGQAETLMAETYRSLVTLPSALSAYRSFFEVLADPERSGAALFHCTTGKDRTGWAAASLLLLLGADEQTAFDDYMETNTDLLPALQPLFDMASKNGIDPDMLEPVLGVRESYLNAALDEVASKYGTMEGYFTTALKLSDSTLDALRTRFVA